MDRSYWFSRVGSREWEDKRVGGTVGGKERVRMESLRERDGERGGKERGRERWKREREGEVEKREGGRGGKERGIESKREDNSPPVNI